MKEHEGFTLVEVLIVITVMGILASMMMMSSSESVSTAKANNIITNLRNFSMAAMAYYTDNMDTFGKTPNTAISLNDVTPYMHNEGDIPDKGSYMITNDSGVWWAGYSTSGAGDAAKIREKLAGRAESSNLSGSSDGNPPAKDSSGKYPAYKDSDSYVWILIRSGRK